MADNLALIVNDLFGRWRTLDGGVALLAIYAFAFQIYADFSGYTDIARGVAKCLGFELTLNFNLPYFATSPKDFWERWHISLSHWLRDYLYISAGGNRGGTLRTYRNLMLTMMLGGLWHGAAGTFVFWGLYQGLLLIVHRVASPWLERIQPTDPIDRACWTRSPHRRDVPSGLFRLADFPLTIDRSNHRVDRGDRPSSRHSGRRLPGSGRHHDHSPLGCSSCRSMSPTTSSLSLERPWYVRSLFYTACFYAIVLAGEFGGQQFIYFQF